MRSPAKLRADYEQRQALVNEYKTLQKKRESLQEQLRAIDAEIPDDLDDLWVRIAANHLIQAHNELAAKLNENASRLDAIQEALRS